MVTKICRNLANSFINLCYENQTMTVAVIVSSVISFLAHYFCFCAYKKLMHFNFKKMNDSQSLSVQTGGVLNLQVVHNEIIERKEEEEEDFDNCKSVSIQTDNASNVVSPLHIPISRNLISLSVEEEEEEGEEKEERKTITKKDHIYFQLPNDCIQKISEFLHDLHLGNFIIWTRLVEKSLDYNTALSETFWTNRLRLLKDVKGFVKGNPELSYITTMVCVRIFKKINDGFMGGVFMGKDAGYSSAFYELVNQEESAQGGSSLYVACSYMALHMNGCDGFSTTTKERLEVVSFVGDDFKIQTEEKFCSIIKMLQSLCETEIVNHKDELQNVEDKEILLIYNWLSNVLNLYKGDNQEILEYRRTVNGVMKTLKYINEIQKNKLHWEVKLNQNENDNVGDNDDNCCDNVAEKIIHNLKKTDETYDDISFSSPLIKVLIVSRLKRKQTALLNSMSLVVSI